MVGLGVGHKVGSPVVGLPDGSLVGWNVDSRVGSRVGLTVTVFGRSFWPPLVGLVFPGVGGIVGCLEAGVGGTVGCLEGGKVVGLKVGLEVGESVGTREGALEGLAVIVGAEVGLAVGFLLWSNTRRLCSRSVVGTDEG